MSDQIKPIVLVDGSSYLYRAFHALPALANSKGQPTGAVYGMINMLKRLIADYQPDYMAVIFDTKGKTFRDEIYAAYKATRHAMPLELQQQIEPIHQIIKAMGIPLLMIEGVEADDVIGTLVNHAKAHQMNALVSTGDKDLAQLVNKQVTLINTMTNTLLDPEGVEKKFGIPPAKIVDYLTLVGDSSDNIPGVPNVGPKTAVKWLKEYGSLDEIVAHADKITGKVGENFRHFLAQLPLTRSLVTIKIDVPLPVDFHDLQMQPPDKIKLIELYKTMEFKNWLAELLSETKIEPTKSQYTLITDKKVLTEWLKEATDIISFDIPTSNHQYMTTKLVGIAIGLASGKAAYIPFCHEEAKTPQLPKEWVIKKIKPLLENPHIKKITNDSKYNMELLWREDIALTNCLYDTMLESYVLDSVGTTHELDSLALKYLGVRLTPYEEIAGKGVKQIPFEQVPIHKALLYAAGNADVISKLHRELWPRIEGELGLKKVFEQIEIPLVSVLASMEYHGVLINPQTLEKQGIELTKRLNHLEKEAYALAKHSFNIHSPKQLQEILFNELKLPILQKTPTGQPSTADNVLQELAIDFALPRIIIESRSLAKLISTYTSKLIHQINPHTKRVHTSYNQSGTATGRLSSSDPNLQNIPIKTPEGRRIRQAFIAPAGYKLLSADYSQIELRLMAHLSQEPNLIKAFKQNLDIHQATAAEVMNLPIEKVTQTMRRNAKAINFGLMYGMSAFGLTKQLGIPRAEAQNYIDRYFARYPQVKAYMNHACAKAKEKGYVETLWGRRLYIPDIKASQMLRQKAAERIAINAPLQGSSADIIKLAMIQIDEWLRTEKIPAHMIMQVHDELVFEVRNDIIDHVKEKIIHYMSTVIQLSVPLSVSVGVGDNWDEASAH